MRSNALQRHLRKRRITLDRCSQLEFAAYGPIGKVPSKRKDYRRARRKIAALEKALWQELKDRGADVLNDFSSSKADCDPSMFRQIRKAFAIFLEL
jgi:hypothetical protein